MNWRSTYKLPASFIIFFVLAFFLLGEQLPALPTYLFGPGSDGSGPNKLHILDLALRDGFLHRPFAYLIIGAVILVLYRIFAWPLAWFVGAVLWIVEQRTLTPLDQRTTFLNTIVFTATGWILLTLAPYFIYRWVDKKWGKAGKRNAILIALAINALVFGFFVYQIYGRGNSLRGRVSSDHNQKTNTPPRSYSCPDGIEYSASVQTMVIENGEKRKVDAEEQNWVEKNCDL